MGIVQDMKDGALSVALRKLVEDKFGEYGVVEDCSIDTAKNRAVLRALLHGENSPVTLVVEHYEVEKSGDEAYLVLSKLSASRKWVTLLLGKLAEGRRIKIPGAMAHLL